MRCLVHARPPSPRRAATLGCLLVAGAGALVCACPAPPTALARGQQAAQEFNQDVRFGRSELLLEHVSPSLRDEFVAHHRSWGAGIRLADVELAGMKAHGDGELQVVVRVSWYRPEEQELRVTTLEQRWRSENGWQLAAERRLDGDIGLLGETVVYQAPPDARSGQFPTIRLGGDGAPR
ncbi:MAG: hypothetical protein JOZ69_18695 [Myxococcales bacterium]|nr:hypothetical protein [Myxococcales bacterium]